MTTSNANAPTDAAWEVALDLLTRYGLITPEVLCRALEDETAAKNYARRWRENDLIESFPLYGTRCFYRLSRAAVARLGVGPEKALSGPLGPQALPQRYGVLCHCCLNDPPHRKLTPQEFAAAFPDYVTRLRSNYYVEGTPTGARLVHMIVDCGASAPRLIKKALRCVVARMRHAEAFRRLVTRGEFYVVIITGDERKAEALRRTQRQAEGRLAARSGSARAAFPIRTSVVPDLLQLL